MRSCTIATVQYQFDPINQWEAFEQKSEGVLRQAKQSGADLVLLPEYAALEIAHDKGRIPLAELSAVNQMHERYLDFFQRMARQYQLYLQPGTFPFKIRHRVYRNRAYFFSPDGATSYQDKLYFTRFEKALGVFQPGEYLQIITTSFAKIGIAICYDSEFPWIAQRLAQAGVELLLVPSCTEKRHGFNRVHLSCRARAIENQIFVANACLVGDNPWSAIVDVNVGAAGVFTPIDEPFPEDGILVLGQWNQPSQLVTTLNFDHLQHCRDNGAVSNFLDLNAARDISILVG